MKKDIARMLMTVTYMSRIPEEVADAANYQTNVNAAIAKAIANDQCSSGPTGPGPDTFILAAIQVECPR